MDIEVAIVGDVRLYCEGLARVLNDQEGISVTGLISNPSVALERVIELSPDLALLDTAMPYALTFVRDVRDAAPNIKVVVLGLSETKAEICRCAEAGVSGFVLREASLATLLRTLRLAIRGELSCSPRAAGFLLHQLSSVANKDAEIDLIACLTSRQLAVLEQLGAGKSNKEIAQSLGIELATVKNHVHQILEKLQVQRRGEAAALWARRPRRRAMLSDAEIHHWL